MNEKVLIVDDDKLLLEMASNLLRSQHIEVITMNDSLAALEMLRRQDIAVVVTDNNMPGISGVELLTSLKEIAPDTVKILMTAYADLSCALSAINQCEVFRFVVKPWNDTELVSAVGEGIHRHHVLLSFRKDEEDVLRSLAQTIELKDPYTRGHCDRVAIFALLIADALNLPNDMKRQIKYGSWLHDCGKIGISETILNGSKGLSAQEYATVKMHSDWGADVAAKANLSQVTRNIIHYHHERYDGSGYPAGLRGKDIPLEARIVSVADVFDALMTDRPYRKKYSAEETCAILRSIAGSSLDPELVTLFLSLISVEIFQEVMTNSGMTQPAMPKVVH